MATMRGMVFLGDRRATVKEFPVPKPGRGEVLVRIKAAAICGSDLHFFRWPRKKINPERIVGHEPAGVVERIGEGVENVKEGDRVWVYHYIVCGRCRFCLSGNWMLCPQRKGLGWHVDGPDADYLLIPASNCFHLPDELTFIDGVFLACNAATSYSALRKLEVSEPETLAIFGLGPVGLAAVKLAKAIGCRVIGIDLKPFRLELARRVGADVVIAADGDVVGKVNELTQGEGVGKVLDTSGSPVAQGLAVQIAKVQGTIALVGLGGIDEPGKTNLDPGTVVFKELRVVGSFVSPIHYCCDLVSFMLRHNLHFDDIVTHRVPLEKAPDAMELVEAGNTGKVIIEG